MTYLVVMIVDDPDICPGILEAWDCLGVSGVTILESTGYGRMQRNAFLDNIPLMPCLADFDQAREVPHRTLLSVVENEEIVEQMVEAAQKFTGDLNLANSGFLFALPVHKVYGLIRRND
jgi:nitrogen regulatory protein PII